MDGSGNVYVAGYFSGTVNFGGSDLESAGGRDLFIAKYTTDGDHLWSFRFGSVGDDQAESVAVDGSGNVLVTGYFQGTAGFLGGTNLTSAGDDDIVLAKFDANGAHLWSKQYGGAEPDQAAWVASDGAGNVLVTGGFQATVDFGDGPKASAGDDDIFIAKFDASGTHVWSEAFLGSPNEDYGRAIVADASLNVFMTGFFEGEVDFGGGNLVSAGAEDMVLAKYNSSGVHQWSQSFGNTAGDGGAGLAVDGSGSVYVTGVFSLTVDFGGGDLTSVAGGFDILLAKYNGGGTHQWSQRFGGISQFDIGYSVAVDATNNVFTTGTFAETVDFGSGPLVSAGGGDIYLGKYDDSPFTAVAITSFDAEERDGAVTLRAGFNSDLGVEAVNVYRGEGDAGFLRIATVTGNESGRFEYVDREVAPRATYRYQIGVVDEDGEFLSPVVALTMGAPVAGLGQNVPNPFNPSTSIPFTLAEESRVTVSIYAPDGSLVRTLLDGVRERGTHRVFWDGRSDGGNAMSSGVYFYRMRAGKTTEARKMVLVR